MKNIRERMAIRAHREAVVDQVQTLNKLPKYAHTYN